MSGSINLRHFEKDIDLVPIGNNLQMVKGQVNNTLDREHKVKVLPRSAPASTILQAGSSDIVFDIPEHAVDYVDGLYLNYTLTNGGASTCGLTDGFSHIDYVNVEANGQLVQTLYGAALRANLLATHTSEQLVGLAVGTKLSTATVGIASHSILAAASSSLMIPIKTILDCVQVPMWMNNINWRITFRMKSGGAIMMSTSVGLVTDLTLSSCFLIIDGRLVSDGIRAQHDAKFRRAVSSFRYLNQDRSVLSLGAATSAVATQQNYNTTGALCYAWLQFLSTSATNETLYTGSAITSFELLQNSQVVHHQLGDNGWLYTYMQTLAPQHWVNTSMFPNINLAYVSLCDDPIGALQRGEGSGFKVIRGDSEVWRLIPGATVASSQLNVYGHFMSHVNIDFNTGQVSAYRGNIE
jgi:hypothetical protein